MPEMKKENHIEEQISICIQVMLGGVLGCNLPLV